VKRHKLLPFSSPRHSTLITFGRQADIRWLHLSRKQDPANRRSEQYRRLPPTINPRRRHGQQCRCSYSSRVSPGSRSGAPLSSLADWHHESSKRKDAQGWESDQASRANHQAIETVDQQLKRKEFYAHSSPLSKSVALSKELQTESSDSNPTSSETQIRVSTDWLWIKTKNSNV
jgi:hypothetical protein